MHTNQELTAKYNELATKLGKPTISLWKNKKDILEKRISELESQLKPTQPVSTGKSVQSHVEFLTEALKSGLKTTEAIRSLMKSFPGITRIQVRHSAKAAGLNPLTARNLFDKIRGDK